MYRTILLFIISVQFSCAQEHNHFKVEVDPNGKYHILKEDQIDRRTGEETRVQASINVVSNAAKFDSLLYANAALLKDTLQITLWRLTASHYNECEIKILNGVYLAKFKSAPDVIPEKKFVVDASFLHLNVSTWKSGDTVRGCIYFRGKCVTQGKEEVVEATGNFKCVIE